MKPCSSTLKISFSFLMCLMILSSSPHSTPLLSFIFIQLRNVLVKNFLLKIAKSFVSLILSATWAELSLEILNILILFLRSGSSLSSTWKKAKELKSKLLKPKLILRLENKKNCKKSSKKTKPKMIKIKKKPRKREMRKRLINPKLNQTLKLQLKKSQHQEY